MLMPIAKSIEGTSPRSFLSTYIGQREESPNRLKIALKEVCQNDEQLVENGKNSDHTVSSIQPDKVDDKKEAINQQHETTVFRIYCKCAECLKYREMLVQLVLEDQEYNILWDRLKALIREFYDIVPQNPDPYEDSMDQVYEKLIKLKTRWYSDGRINKQKNIQLSLSSHLPLSNEMTFILVFSMPYTRDPHQLFELLCIMVMAYGEGLKKLITTSADGKSPVYNPIQLLNFILDGYEKFCSSAKKLSSLLFELQRDHLQQFSLTWALLNKRMYQRWIYLEVQELIPECILKLKDLLGTEEYSTMAHRLIKFDEDMISITQTWIEVWTLLQGYHMEEEDIERRARINSFSELLRVIKSSDFEFSNYEWILKAENVPISQCAKIEDRDEVWAVLVNYLKHSWHDIERGRKLARLQSENCVKCDSALACHLVDCDCISCLFAGGPYTNEMREAEPIDEYSCTKCSFYEALHRDYMDLIKKDYNRTSEKTPDCEKSIQSLNSWAAEDDSDDGIDEILITNHCYHLSWAVFKHLSSRKKYTASHFDARHLCSFQDPPCSRNECRVATHIIAGLYPLNFTKFLIKTYQPLNEEERKELMNIQKLYFSYLLQKLCCDDTSKLTDPLHQMDLLWNIDVTDYTLFCDIGSAFAECYLIDVPIPIQELLDSCFIVDNNDIELNMYWLECIYIFKESENSPLKKIENDPKVLELQLRMQMDQISLNKAKLCAQGKLLTNSVEQTQKSALVTTNKIQKDVSSDKSQTAAANTTPKKVNSIVPPKTSQSIASGSSCTESKCKKHDLCDLEHLTEKDATLVDAVKIAVKEKLNQKLQAELKSLKKEHSVLKEMVRDFEYLKENEENNLATKKEKCGPNDTYHCCPEHSEAMENHSNHTKMCHRGDGQCTCYYCTIFGHAQECNHGRINETRDRLRKRLHLIHNKGSAKSHGSKNIKNQPTAIKKMLATKNSAASTSGINSVSTASKSINISKIYGEQKDNDLNENLEASFVTTAKNPGPYNNSKCTSSKKITTSSSGKTTSINGASNHKTDKEKEFERLKEILDKCKFVSCDNCDEYSGSKMQENIIKPNDIPDATLASVRRASFCPVFPHETASLDDILDFIEGNSTNKKDSQRKAAKKAKQKQKKEDIKRIEELEQLRNQFHEIYFKEFDIKNELKNLKSVKKRDKRQVSELEGNIKKCGKLKAKIEANILESIGTLKNNNPEFKFAYLPTKEQQMEKLQKQQPQQLPKPQPQHQNNSIHTSVTQLKDANEKSGVHISHIGDMQQPQSEMIVHQSKRMVTIRRVNMPHAEPQVTVTAKGPSPDKDKLLYTFINGQMVTAGKSNERNTTIYIPKPDTTSNRKSSVTAKSPAPVTSIATTAAKDNKKKKAKKNSTNSEVQLIGNSIKTLTLKDEPIADNNTTIDTTTNTATNTITTKKEKKKVKAVKYEYADPNYKINKFDLLDMDDEDDGYYLESSEEESVDEPSQTIVKPIPIKKEQLTQPVQSQQSVQRNKIDNNKQLVNASELSSLNKSNNATNAALKANKTKNNNVKQIDNTVNKSANTIVEPNLSKKQKKKLAQQQKQLQEQVQQQQCVAQQKPSVEKSTNKSDSMVKSLTGSMQRLQLNSDTTIELVKDNHATGCNDDGNGNKMSANISIMDQLNRGVKVEGLMLPPGITLTRVDPNLAENLRAKKESIGRITQPAPQQYQQPPEYQRPPPFLTPNGPIMPGQNTNGFIMVDAMQNMAMQQSNEPNSKKGKKNKKKKKNKNVNGSGTETNAENQPKLVTLRNPLFQSHNDNNCMQPQIPMAQRNPPMCANPPASIIKHENGMFTIRNTALHQALSNGINQNYRPYPADNMYSVETKPEKFSYFSEIVGSTACASTDKGRTQTSSKPSQPSHMAIGSEIKNAHQMKNMPWYPINQQKNPSSASEGDLFTNMSHLNTQRCYSPFDLGTSFGFNNDFLGASTNNQIPMQTMKPSTNQYYDATNSTYHAFSGPPSDSSSLFGSSSSTNAATTTNTNHCCDNSSTSQDASNFFSNGISDHTYFDKYDDTSFLHNVPQAQKLNSEVTIHNISSTSKYNPESMPMKFNDGVEITRINGPVPSREYNLNPNLAVGSHRQPSTSNDIGVSATSEFGENIFIPNHSVNLNELEVEERDIETFKRFDYYFEPPKHKPKVNFNVKDIVVAKKSLTSDCPSLHFGEQSSTLSSTPHPEDESHHDTNTTTSMANNPFRPHPVANHSYMDNFLHGIIGDEH